jgi:hypothetical protein
MKLPKGIRTKTGTLVRLVRTNGRTDYEEPFLTLGKVYAIQSIDASYIIITNNLGEDWYVNEEYFLPATKNTPKELL